MKGCIRDTIPRYARAKQLQNHHATDDADSEIDGKPGQKGVMTSAQHIEDA